MRCRTPCEPRWQSRRASGSRGSRCFSGWYPDPSAPSRCRNSRECSAPLDPRESRTDRRICGSTHQPISLTLAHVPSIASMIYSTSSCLRSDLAANRRSREERKAWLGEDGRDTLAPALRPCTRHEHVAAWNDPTGSARTYD